MTSLLLTAALALAQGPPTTITNAQVETRAATQSVEREIAALAARKDDRWVGYRVALSRQPPLDGLLRALTDCARAGA